MKSLRHAWSWLSVSLAPLLLGGCATAYTGPVEVTRFVAQERSALAQAEIEIRISDDIADERMRADLVTAVAAQLSAIGYGKHGISVGPEGSAPIQASQTAEVNFSQSAVAGADRRGPVSVGVGGSTGSYGSGVGLGLGINLGGGAKPRGISKLSVRIRDRKSAATLWEGRAQLIASPDSSYADPQASAEILASALFRDFPGGNGETVTITIDELLGAP